MRKPNLYINEIKSQPEYVTATYIAKDYGLSAQTLNKILCKVGFLINTYDENRQYVVVANDTRYFKFFHFNKSLGEYIETNEWNNRDTLKFSKAGREKIYQLLKMNGLLPLCECLYNYILTDDIFSKDDLISKYTLVYRTAGELDGINPIYDTIYISYKSNNNKYNDFTGYNINHLPLSDDEYKYIHELYAKDNAFNKITKLSDQFVIVRAFMINKFNSKIIKFNYEEKIIKENKKKAKKLTK